MAGRDRLPMTTKPTRYESMKSMRRIVIVLVSVALLSTVGWLRSQDTTVMHPQQRSLSGLDLAHDVGSVVEGTKVEHTFVTRNVLQVPITIADETDMEKTCGCTTLEPSARRLAPGESATVRMRVDTTGKSGRFRVGGVIRWRLENGESWPVNLRIEGIAKTILASQPGIVRFSATDVANKSTKELLVFNSREVDWSTLNVQIDSPYATLVESSVHSDHLRLLLRACPPADVSDFSATLRVTANLTEAHGDITHCALAVPVQASQRIGVHVSPRVVFANWSRKFNKGTTRFLVRELTSASPELIASISCDGFRVTWAAKNISPPRATPHHTLQVELGLSSPDDPAFDLTQAGPIHVRLASGRTIEVPVYFVAPQDRS